MNDDPSKPIIAERYIVLEELGQGASGKVYKCWDEKLAKECAVKVLTVTTEQSIGRFQMEAKAAAKLQHPNIIRVDDFGSTNDGLLYLSMEYVNGTSLEDVLTTSGRLELEDALPIISGLCSGLGHAHASGVIHRDIKPSNVMLSEDEEGIVTPKLVDFGIAKLQEADMKLTTTGSVVGTVAYMSPEAVSSDPLDARSDIYSLGCMIYETLSGKTVFDGNNLFDILKHQVSTKPKSMTEQTGIEFPDELEQFVSKFLEKDPADRYQSAREVNAALTEVSQKLHVEYEPATFNDSPPYNTVAERRTSGTVLLSAGILACSILTICSIGYLFYIAFQHFSKVETNTKPLEIDKLSKEWFKYGGWSPNQKVLRRANGQVLQSRYYSDIDLADAANRYAKIKHWRLVSCNALGDGFKHLVALPIETLEIPEGVIDKVAFEYLPRLKNLRTLSLEDCHYVKDEYLESLGASKSLKRLTVSGKLVTGNACNYVNKISTLAALSLPQVKVGEQDIQALENLSAFRELALSKVELSDKVLKAIASLPHLEKLSLLGCQFTKSGINRLAEARHLKWLDLQETNLKDDEFQYLSKCSGLRTVHLSDCESISAEAFKNINRFQNLNRISISPSSAGTSEEMLLELSKSRSLEVLIVKVSPEFKPGVVPPDAVGNLDHATNLRSFALVNATIDQELAHAIASLNKIQNYPMQKCKFIQNSKSLLNPLKYKTTRHLIPQPW